MSTYRILMYSHDTYGLGHIRRTMAIAQQLRRAEVNVLILTGSPIAGRFDIPEQIDFVRIPGMIKRSNDLYLPHTIKIEAQQALNIRQSIIKATAKAFQPHLFIVDKAPLGLKREIVPTLKWLKKQQEPVCRTVLGLRDIMDDAESTIKDWRSKRIYDVLDKYYSEIWVYGHREMYDPIAEYRIPERVSDKMIFTGYIPRKPIINGGGNGNNAKPGNCKGPLVLVTTGGGGDGHKLLDTYLRMLEARGGVTDFRTVIVSGPFMAKAERKEIAARAKLLGVKFYHFYRRMEQLMAAADVVVSMGGYNTVCEILSHRKVSLLVPRETPRLEQRIRAEVLKEHGLADFVGWSEMTPQLLGERLEALLNEPHAAKRAVDAFNFTGLDVMLDRLDEFRAVEGL